MATVWYKLPESDLTKAKVPVEEFDVADLQWTIKELNPCQFESYDPSQLVASDVNGRIEPFTSMHEVIYNRRAGSAQNPIKFAIYETKRKMLALAVEEAEVVEDVSRWGRIKCVGEATEKFDKICKPLQVIEKLASAKRSWKNHFYKWLWAKYLEENHPAEVDDWKKMQIMEVTKPHPLNMLINLLLPEKFPLKGGTWDYNAYFSIPTARPVKDINLKLAGKQLGIEITDVLAARMLTRINHVLARMNGKQRIGEGSERLSLAEESGMSIMGDRPVEEHVRSQGNADGYPALATLVAATNSVSRLPAAEEEQLYRAVKTDNGHFLIAPERPPAAAALPLLSVSGEGSSSSVSEEGRDRTKKSKKSKSKSKGKAKLKVKGKTKSKSKGKAKGKGKRKGKGKGKDKEADRETEDDLPESTEGGDFQDSPGTNSGKRKRDEDDDLPTAKLARPSESLSAALPSADTAGLS